MNAGSILLIKFLLTISFCLKGAVASMNTVYGILDHSVNLDISLSQGKFKRIDWEMGTKPIGKVKSSGKSFLSEKYEIFLNGTLKIKELLKSDAADYTVYIYDENGTSNSSKITLDVVEALPPLILTYECSKKIVSCAVKYNEMPKPSFKLFHEKEEQKKGQELTYVNMMWKVTQQLKSNSGKVSCEASISTSLQKTEILFSCPNGLNFFLIMGIGGGVAIFVIFVAILICCIRKKRAERRTLEERELRPVNDALKYRKLPQPPVHAAPSQPHPQQRQPPPCSAEQQQPGPPLPRPRPQQKPPRRMKDKL